MLLIKHFDVDAARGYYQRNDDLIVLKENGLWAEMEHICYE